LFGWLGGITPEVMNKFLRSLLWGRPNNQNNHFGDPSQAEPHAEIFMIFYLNRLTDILLLLLMWLFIEYMYA